MGVVISQNELSVISYSMQKKLLFNPHIKAYSQVVEIATPLKI